MLQGYLPFLLDGARVTVALALLSFLGSIVFGLIGVTAKLSRIGAIRALAGGYTTVIRGVPELIVILLIYYGLPVLLRDGLQAAGFENVRVDLNPFAVGVLTLSLIYGAFATEVLRGAYQALSAGQIEAAKAVGMRPLRIAFRVILPQMVPLCLAGMSNIWMVIVKATALMSAIQLDELMRKADLAAGATRRPFDMILAAAAIYLVITAVSVLVQHWLQYRVTTKVPKSHVV